MSTVRDFGAVGDGKIDDTEALQHAIDERAGNVVLPLGTYRITRTLQASIDRHGPLAITGAGATARILSEANGPAIRIVGTHEGSADPNSFKTNHWESERMPVLADFEIVGQHDRADGVQLIGTMQPTLSRLLIRRTRVGIHLTDRNRNLLVSNCHIYHARPGGIGIYFEGVNLHQAIIIGCHISYQPHAGIKIVRSEVRNLQITGCDIEYNYDPEAPDSADVWIDAREGTIREGTIASNTIQAKLSPGGSNLRIEGPTDPGLSRGAGLWTITGNILQSQAVNLRLTSCRGLAINGNSFASGFERSTLISNCRHISLSGNTFDYNPDYGEDHVDGVTILDSAGISLTGCLLESSRTGAPQGQGAAIAVSRSSEITLSGCQVLDPEVRGICLEDVQNAVISGCTVLDRRFPRQLTQSIEVVGNSRDVLVAGNLLTKGTLGALAIDPQAGESSNNRLVP